jgi:UDP-N-acetylmuramate--alanine ligase
MVMDVRGVNIHFMGIGGIGVSALALLAKKWGATVSGCDRAASTMTDSLQAQGIEVTIGHESLHTKDCDWLVYTSAVAADNQELCAAKERGIAVRRGTFLAQLLAGKQVVGICGTHGKTTTTWLVAQLMQAAGFIPTVLMGGVPADGGSNLIVGDDNLIVTELDESDGSFLEAEVTVGVITNVEPDHLDHYGTAEAVDNAFRTFVGQMQKSGTLVVCGDDDGACDLAKYFAGQVIVAGEADRCDIQVQADAGAEVIISGLEDKELHAPFTLPGKHNRSNLACALGAVKSITDDFDVVSAVTGCRGVSRRFECVGMVAGAQIIDDYAHHPTEVAAALNAARQLNPLRLVAVFQPHLYSRTKFFAEGFAEALALADIVILTDIYPAREEPIPGVSSGLISSALLKYSQCECYGPFAVTNLKSEVLRHICEGDMVMFLGAGNISEIAHEMVARV